MEDGSGHAWLRGRVLWGRRRAPVVSNSNYEQQRGPELLMWAANSELWIGDGVGTTAAVKLKTLCLHLGLRRCDFDNLDTAFKCKKFYKVVSFTAHTSMTRRLWWNYEQKFLTVIVINEALSAKTSTVYQNMQKNVVRKLFSQIESYYFSLFFDPNLLILVCQGWQPR